MTARFNIRKIYGAPYLEPRNLLGIQTESFSQFLQRDIPDEKRQLTGLQNLFKSFFPFSSLDGRVVLNFVSYSVGDPRFSPDKCRLKNVSYDAPVHGVFRLAIMQDGQPVEVREENIYLFRIPLMTSDASFIVNGVEKIVLSQIVRAPGAYYSKNDDVYSGTILPNIGAWIQFEFDKKSVIFARIDKSPPVKLYQLLWAFGANNEEIGARFKDMHSELGDPPDHFRELYEAYKSSFPQDNSSIHSLYAKYEALRRVKKNVIPTIMTGARYFDQMLLTPRRYDLSNTGRVKLNLKTGLDISESQMLLTKEDIMAVAEGLINLRKENGIADNIDSHENKIVKQPGRQLAEFLRMGFNAMEKDALEIMYQPDLTTLMPSTVIKSSHIAQVMTRFFNANPLCQFAQAINPLAELSQKRRVTAIGRGGLERDSAGLEARDIQPTQYGRICPIESPEGKNIGIVSHLSTYARVGEIGLIETPYYVVKDGEITEKLKWLRPDQESKHVITHYNAADASGKRLQPLYIPGDTIDEKSNEPAKIPLVMARKYSQESKGMEVDYVDPSEVTLIDVSPIQLLGPGAAMVPFVEHCDGHRALMGSGMMKQATPLLCPESPLVGTGMEYFAAREYSNLIYAEHDGIVESVEGKKILIRRTDTAITVDTYKLKKFQPTNQGMCIIQKPLVQLGERVNKGDLIADCHAMKNGELALGKNLTVAYMSWNGYGYEDSIVISERLVKEDVLTSVHIKQFEMDERKTLNGSELITREVPGAGHEVMHALGEDGIATIGMTVQEGDYLVGKVTPKGDETITPEEKLIRSIFGNTPSQVKDASLEVPPGVSGVVTDIVILERRKQKKAALFQTTIEKEEARRDKNEELEIIRSTYSGKMSKLAGKHIDLFVNKAGYRIAPSELTTSSVSFLAGVTLNMDTTAPDKAVEKARDFIAEYRAEVDAINLAYREQRYVIKEVDDLPDGVLRRVIVTLTENRKIEVGDKLAGRYGNKGICSLILPEEDMPFLDDGTPVDILLNPLGVPSRMNIGQLLESLVGFSLYKIGDKIAEKAANNDISAARSMLSEIYSDKVENILAMKEDEIRNLAKSVKKGIPIASAGFAGAEEHDIEKIVTMAGMPHDGKFKLRDGRTGQYFDREILVGRKFVMKLYHLVKDKMHARSVGPYSAITQQPLKGRAKMGGQRMGEMEVWAIYGYGAAHVLHEMMTVKSDDMEGRNEMHEQIVKNGRYFCGFRQTPSEAYNVLKCELQSLCLSIEHLSKEKTAEIRAQEDKYRDSVVQAKMKLRQEVGYVETKERKRNVKEDTTIEDLEAGEDL